MTAEGHRALDAELKRLKSEERPAVIQAIAEAREHGDLSENAEYHAAKERQGWIEGRVAEIEDKMARAQVIDVSAIPPTGKVIFGATVDLINSDDDSEVTYRIVGEDEANVKANLISVSSPISRALVGKSEGDEVVVKAPSGDIFYEIEKVRYI